MAKWFGKIGFAETSETKPGVWEEVIIEKEYFGDLLSRSRRYEQTQQLNDDLNISNRISILADPYANNHFHTMRYAEFAGVKWKVTSVDVQYPRLEISLGGVYNVETEN